LRELRLRKEPGYRIESDYSGDEERMHNEKVTLKRYPRFWKNSARMHEWK
jgi:hypothetical protein